MSVMKLMSELAEAVARAEDAEERLYKAEQLLLMTEAALNPLIRYSPEHQSAVQKLINAMRGAGYQV